MIIKPLAEALEQNAELIKNYLGKALHPNHGFHALNTAMLELGFFYLFTIWSVSKGAYCAFALARSR